LGLSEGEHNAGGQIVGAPSVEAIGELIRGPRCMIKHDVEIGGNEGACAEDMEKLR